MPSIDQGAPYTQGELATFVEQTNLFDKTALFGSLLFFCLSLIPVGLSIWGIVSLVQSPSLQLVATMGVVGCFVIGAVCYWGLLLLPRIELLHMQQVGIGQRIADLRQKMENNT